MKNFYSENIVPYSNKDSYSQIRVGSYESNIKKRYCQGEASCVRGETKVISETKHTNLFALLVSLLVIFVLWLVAYFTMEGFIRYSTVYKFNNNLGAVCYANETTKNYKAMVLIEEQSGRVLESYNEHKRLPMASTTKIATLIVALENYNGDLNKKFVVPECAVGIEGTSIYLKRGEKIKFKDLLYGLILASGNDCASAIATIVSGSEEKFVSAMNNFAKNLKLENTNFTNPHGLHSDNHFTTAYDLAQICKYANGNKLFKEICSTERYTIDKTNKYETRYLKNKQKLLFDDYKNVKFVGTKSGYTPEAGRCLVTSAESGGAKYICVVLNSPNMFEDSCALVNKASKEYSFNEILPAYNHITSVATNEKGKRINLYSKDSFNYLLKEDEKSKIKIVDNYPEVVKSSLKKNSKVGSRKIYLDDKLVFETDILTADEFENENVLDNFKKIISEF